MHNHPAFCRKKENQVKYLKMLGLAAVAAMGLMAFVGAGTASASELCTDSACTITITKIEASLVGGTAKLEDTEKHVIDTCTGGTVKITNITGGTGVTPTGSVPIEDLTWTGCSFPTKTVGNGTAEATEASGGGTTITAKGSEVTINTVLFGSCVYGVGTGLDLGSVSNGGNELAINKTVNKISGSAACPPTSIWNATYKITNHTQVFFKKS
jgi:hypothetical protein